MHAISSLQELLNPLFPGLIGMQLTEVTPERVVGSLEVRPDLCTTGEILHGGAIMASWCVHEFSLVIASLTGGNLPFTK